MHQGATGAQPMPSNTQTILCRYYYDALDSLIGLNRSGQDELQRFYCKSRLATEIQGRTQFSIMQHGDQLLAQQQRMGGSLETDLLATDKQRSVLHAVGQRPRPRIVYCPYGYHPAESGLTSLLEFNGERRDAVTGCYLLGNGYRAFNPFLMRFNSADMLSPFGKGGPNSYAYCSGDPVNRGDRSGKFSIPWLKGATSSFMKSRADGLKNIPWYSWSSGDIDIAKNVTRSPSPFGISDYQPEKLFRPNTSNKNFSSAHIMPLNPFPHNAGGIKGETLLKRSANAITGNELVEMRKRHKGLVVRVDGSYYRNDLMKLNYERRVQRAWPSTEYFNMKHYGDLEHHQGLMKAVRLELALEFEVSERQRSLIRTKLRSAIRTMRDLGRIF